MRKEEEKAVSEEKEMTVRNGYEEKKKDRRCLKQSKRTTREWSGTGDQEERGDTGLSLPPSIHPYESSNGTIERRRLKKY